MLLFISLVFFSFAIPTLGPEPYEGMDPDEPDTKLIPRVLNSGVTFNSPTRSTLMQYDKVYHLDRSILEPLLLSFEVF